MTSSESMRYLLQVVDIHFLFPCSFFIYYNITTGYNIKSAVENLLDTAKYAWFAGYMGNETANSILLHQLPGTFLIRFTTSKPSDLAVNYVTAEGIVKSYAIQYLGK